MFQSSSFQYFMPIYLIGDYHQGKNIHNCFRRHHVLNKQLFSLLPSETLTGSFMTVTPFLQGERVHRNLPSYLIEKKDSQKRLIIDESHVSLPSIEKEISRWSVKDRFVLKVYLSENVLMRSKKTLHLIQ